MQTGQPQESVGKFKNRKATIIGFSSDENNQPVAQTDKGEHKIFKTANRRVDACEAMIWWRRDGRLSRRRLRLLRVQFPRAECVVGTERPRTDSGHRITGGLGKSLTELVSSPATAPAGPGADRPQPVRTAHLSDFPFAASPTGNQTASPKHLGWTVDSFGAVESLQVQESSTGFNRSAPTPCLAST